jgi:hypothetical protein
MYLCRSVYRNRNLLHADLNEMVREPRQQKAVCRYRTMKAAVHDRFAEIRDIRVNQRFRISKPELGPTRCAKNALAVSWMPTSHMRQRRLQKLLMTRTSHFGGVAAVASDVIWWAVVTDVPSRKTSLGGGGQ